MKTVALLGCRGQIGRSLIDNLPRDWMLRLFCGEPSSLDAVSAGRSVCAQSYEAFGQEAYDIVINTAGPGDPAQHRAMGGEMLRITERFDNMVLDYLSQHPEAGYIYMSSGAVYGPDSLGGPSQGSTSVVDVDHLDRCNAYALAKICAEAKHRLAGDWRIADLRIFGFFSRYINLQSQFFAAQAVAHLCRGATFHTHSSDFVRDYISPRDLADLIVWIIGQGIPNQAFDAVSAAPVSKFQMLDTLRERFGLRYVIDDGVVMPPVKSPSEGVTSHQKSYKSQHCSKFTSLETISRAVDEIMSAGRGKIRVGV